METLEYDYNEKFSMLATWLDLAPPFTKNFVLNYYPSDNTLELVDVNTKKLFLQRIKMDNLDIKDIYVGNILRVYGRQIKITDYANTRTKNILGKTAECTFTMIKPLIIKSKQVGEVIAEIQQRGYRISAMRMCRLSQKNILDLYETSIGDAFLPFVLEHLNSGPVVAMELVGEDIVRKWLEILGPEDPNEARRIAPESIRARYGFDNKIRNGFAAAETPEDAARQTEFFFPKKKTKTTPKLARSMQNTTCCVVKPHAIDEGKLGYIITAIYEANFTITGMQLLHLCKANADEFLEVYKGVVSDYNALLLSLVEGPCVAMEISGDDEDVHGAFRKFVGPHDPHVARLIRPHTLRARFGCEGYRNAVHCTDLRDDAVTEVEYLFDVLDK